MTPLQLIEQVYYKTGRHGAYSAETYHNETLNALNQVQRETSLSLNLQELTAFDKTTIFLAANTTNYDLPTDFLKPIIGWDNNRYESELTRIFPQEYKTYLSDIDTTTGTFPRYYDILDSDSNVKQIYLFPLRASIPSGTIASVAIGTVAGTVIATDTDHGLATGDVIVVTTTGGTDYSGTHTITRVDDDTFYFTAAWGATGSGTWVQRLYVPIAYIKKLDDLTAVGSANILTTYYPDLLIEGSAYYLYRDVIYRDQPEKIAFREKEYLKQIEIVKRAQRQPDRINTVAPKRLLPSIQRHFTVQTSGYTS